MREHSRSPQKLDAEYVLAKVPLYNRRGPRALEVGTTNHIPSPQRAFDSKEVFSRGWCTNCQNLREQLEKIHHPQDYTGDVRRGFCLGSCADCGVRLPSKYKGRGRKVCERGTTQTFLHSFHCPAPGRSVILGMEEQKNLDRGCTWNICDREGHLQTPHPQKGHAK